MQCERSLNTSDTVLVIEILMCVLGVMGIVLLIRYIRALLALTSLPPPYHKLSHGPTHRIRLHRSPPASISS